MDLRINKYILISSLLILSILSIFNSLYNYQEDRMDDLKSCNLREVPLKLEEYNHKNKKVVIIIGDGVYEKTISENRSYDINYAQGFDIYEGIKAGMNTADFELIKDDIIVEFIDDGGNTNCIKQLSKFITTSPSVLCVIGHSTSSNSAAGLENYQKGNIPMILPAATRPNILENNNNAFRLPSNDNIQGEVVADFITRSNEFARVLLIEDATPEAKEYSSFLSSTIKSSIGKNIVNTFKVNLNEMNYKTIVEDIPSEEYDYIAFCGYGSMARKFFKSLNDFSNQEANKKFKKPKIVLSDGCNISGINVFKDYNFEFYYSFPSGNIDRNKIPKLDTSDYPIIFHQLINNSSYENFGYDAMMLFTKAYSNCKEIGDISRKNIIEQLNGIQNFKSLLNPYKFENGENIYHKYFIYNLMSKKVEKEYSMIDIDKIILD